MATAPEVKVVAPEVKAEVKAEVPAASLKIGDVKRLVAVHGRLVHPSGAPDYDTDKSAKVEADSWHVIQFEAGKLKFED